LKIFVTYQQKLNRVEGKTTYTTELLGDNNRMVKKFGEETAEFLQAFLLEQTENELVGEAADVWYAVSLMLAKRGISPLAVLEEDIARNNNKEIND
jgi:phosphoribosyl-ATP pyrophosphohydrolase